MNKLKVLSIIMLIISTIAILYGLIFTPEDWIVITIAIIFIPFFILSVYWILNPTIKIYDINL